jgi:hypothetical protein
MVLAATALQVPAYASELSKGAIDAKYQKLGGEKSALGKATGDEASKDDGGACRPYEKGLIFWSPSTGAHYVQNDVSGKWAEFGLERSILGYPISDESANGSGRYINFQGGSIYYSPESGAWEIHGPIRDKWIALGSVRSDLGYPTSDVRVTADGIGRYSHFQRGTIYWSPWSGAHEIHGAIRERWFAMSREVSYLGYPTSDEKDYEGGRRSDFQNGHIDWTAKTGAKDSGSNTKPLDLLEDTDVRELVGKIYVRKHALDRDDLLEIFRLVQKDGGVSKAEFHDLQTLVAHGRLLTMPEHVRLLASKVVFGDPANLHFRGADLGNLEAGSDADRLEALVQKWFLGTDHPETGRKDVTYQLVKGTLFGTGAVYHDVEQGLAGDCYYLASLAEIALRHPAAIRQMFIDNGDDTYTVLFRHDGGFDCVTVDKYLPIDAKKHFIFADLRHNPKDPNLKLWVPLAEKAYAQLAESGWLRATKAANSYVAVGSGGLCGIANLAVEGTGARYQALDFDAIVKALQSGEEITFTSKGNKEDTLKNKIAQGHAYALLSVDVKERTVTLFNPWGLKSGPAFPGEVTLSWTQVQESFVSWTSVTR